MEEHAEQNITQDTKQHTILVCGSRTFDDYECVSREITKYITDLREKTGLEYEFTILHGGCTGADKLASKYAKNNEFKVIKKMANWNKYGKSAGPIRNHEMILLKPDVVFAFSIQEELTRGTRDMVKQAKSHNVKTIIITKNTHTNEYYVD